ncbi:MAG: AI-2E family transporter [Chloroflexota bacterium]|nr:AI-2E family transporter [Chloroflexota bacterium]
MRGTLRRLADRAREAADRGDESPTPDVRAPELAPSEVEVSSSEISVTAVALRVTLVVVGVVLALILAYEMSELLLIVIVAVIVAAAMHGPALAIERRGVPRPLAVVVAYLGLAAVIGALVAVIATPLVTQMQDLIENGPEIAGDFRRRAIDFVDGLAGAGTGEALAAQIEQGLADVDVAEALQLPLQAASALANLVIIVFLSAFLVLERDRARKWIVPLLAPEKREPAEAVARTVFRRLGSFVHGQLLLMTIVGVGMAVILLVLGVPFVLPLALFAFLAEAVPMIGPWIALLPAAVVAFAQGPLQGLLLLVLWFVLQQVESYILTPAVLGRVQHLSATVVLLSVLAGFQLAGLVGALIAVPVVAGLAIVVEKVLRPAREEEIAGNAAKG